MTELEKIGLAGPSHLREMLTSSENPIQAIQEFQENTVEIGI